MRERYRNASEGMAMSYMQTACECEHARVAMLTLLDREDHNADEQSRVMRSQLLDLSSQLLLVERDKWIGNMMNSWNTAREQSHE